MFLRTFLTGGRIVMSGMMDRITAQIPYRYKNAPIPGGGYVTGFVFHKRVPGILYARTDIGGVYRYLYGENRWKPYRPCDDA